MVTNAGKQKRENCVVMDAVKDVLPEQRNHMGWLMLELWACWKYYQNKGTTQGGERCDVHA
jgi:hypothetical protein